MVVCNDLCLYYYLCRFWGKFGEADNKPQTRTLQNGSDWDTLVVDDSVIMKSVHVYNDDVIEIVTVKKEGACEPNVKGSIFVVLFTTALARLKLYDVLKKTTETFVDTERHTDCQQSLFCSKICKRGYLSGVFEFAPSQVA